jgi:hypothetical protein
MTDPTQSKPSSWQVTVAAQGIAAAQFARCGFDVSVQYGADKPKYDLVVAKAGNLLKISVKGSEDGLWNLAQPFLKRATDLSRINADYAGAINLWLDHHGARTWCCLIQFKDVSIGELPRIYLASPQEVAQKLRGAAMGRGDTTLYEECEWIYPGDRAGTADKLPAEWRFSQQRIEELLAVQETVPLRSPLYSSVDTANLLFPVTGKLAPSPMLAPA